MRRPSARGIATAVFRKSAAAAADLAIIGGALAVGLAGSAVPAQAAARPSFLALATPGESFGRIAHQAAISDGAQVTTVIQAMAGRVAAGHAVDMPQERATG